MHPFGCTRSGTATAYAFNNGTMGGQIANVAADAQSNFTMSLGSYAGAVMLRMNAGTYTDEATGHTTSMGSSDAMMTVMPTVNSSASVTGMMVAPMTSMAQSRAQAMTGGMVDANIRGTPATSDVRSWAGAPAFGSWRRRLNRDYRAPDPQSPNQVRTTLGRSARYLMTNHGCMFKPTGYTIGKRAAPFALK
ncbi:MAG: hypothetical protein OEV90_00980 [Gammaproteobacteria bacterium]|nr:hypothetical protein [Gammaproteobacteria bacterium]